MEHERTSTGEEELHITSSVPTLQPSDAVIDTTTTCTGNCTATNTSTAAVSSAEREYEDDVVVSMQHQQIPPLQTLLEQGHLPTYKNQTETMIISNYYEFSPSSIPMAIATNVYETTTTTTTTTTDDRSHQVDVVVNHSDYPMGGNDNVVLHLNHSNSNNEITTSNTESFAASMNRRLDDQYRQLVVASYERYASSRTNEPHRRDFNVATSSVNGPANDDRNNGFCGRNDPKPGIEDTVSNVTGYIRCRRRRWRFRDRLLLGLTTFAIAIVIITINITTSRRTNTTTSPERRHHPDDEAQSMMKMPSTSFNQSGDDTNVPMVGMMSFLPIDSTDELYNAVDEYMQLLVDYTMYKNNLIDDNVSAPEALLTYRYGYPMNHWDVSRITNFTSVFDGQRNMQLQYYFNENLSSWNVTNATNMFRMFAKLNSYVGYGLEHWNVQNVMNMRSTFHDAFIFQGNISHWDVSRVQSFDRMFTDTHLFNTNISFWNTSSAESMSSMFQMAQSFDQDLSQWNVHRVQDFSKMFLKARSFNGDITRWNTSSATDMGQMFADADMFNQDLSEWNVQNVLQFSQMFASATHFNHSLCHWGEQLWQHHIERNGVIVNLSGMFNATSCLNTSDPIYTTTASSEYRYGPFCHYCIV